MFNWIARLLGLGARRVPTSVLGQAIFPGPGHEENAEEDRRALGCFFEAIDASRGSVPTCGVLFVYGKIEGNGSVTGASHSLREIIRKSGAWVVVVASENSIEHCMAAAAPVGFGQANLVLVGERRGPLFNSFFTALFQQMVSGVSMPMAWVRLAPQGPDGHSELPETVFLCERGHVVLPKPRPVAG